MTPVDIIVHRTSMSEDEAIFYVRLADMKIRAHLDVDDSADLSQYLFQRADIAVLFWQKDRATRQASGSIGYESLSVSEGGVSKTTKSLNGSFIVETYDGKIQDVLNGLNSKSEGLVVFL